MNRYWHVADGSVRTPSGGTHRPAAPVGPPPTPGGQAPERALSVDERFETILVLERLQETTPSRLLHDVAGRAIASLEEPGR